MAEIEQIRLLIRRIFFDRRIDFKLIDIIFAIQVKRSQYIFSTGHLFSSLFMMMALLWLTVSTPFVYQAQKIQREVQKQNNQQGNINPFSNTTEEKNETSVNTLSEYLHDHPFLEQNVTILVRLYKRYPFTIYCEHHPELLSPPPEV